MSGQQLDHVNYDALDAAKQACIEAGKRTTEFAADFGFIPDDKFGASANVFSLNLKPYLKAGVKSLHVTLLPEGLGTADDARPDNLSDEELTGFWYNIGFKMMSALTNDAASSGMQTVLISLYLPSSTPELVFTPQFLKGFLDGFVEGCHQVGCVYFSGETPQLKNKLHEGIIDVAGALFGILPAGVDPINSDDVASGDQIVFVESSGPHENGFTSFRALAEQLPEGYRTKLPSGQEYWQALNAPSKLYTPLIQSILRSGIRPTNVEPISGHGWQKLMRPAKPFRYVIEQMLPIPEIFEFIQEQTDTPPAEMINKFNYGAGLAIFVKTQEEADKIIQEAAQHDLKAIIAGHVEAAPEREVFIKPLSVTLSGEAFQLSK